MVNVFFFFFSSRRRHTRWNCDWSSDVCSSDLFSYDTHGAEDSKGHRQIESSAFLAHVGRSEVDGHALAGIAEAGIDQGRFDALAAFSNGGVRHADGDELAAGAGIQVDFDVDQMRIDAEDGGRKGTEQGHRRLVAASGSILVK